MLLLLPLDGIHVKETCEYGKLGDSSGENPCLV